MVKLGKPLPKANEIATPSEEEVNKVIARWNANCPPFYVGLLEAQSINEKNPTARFLYDRAKMQYTHRKSGRVLSASEIRKAFIATSQKLVSK